MSTEPASPSHCPHCGEPLPTHSSGLMDLCPRCLLATGTATLTADGKARAFTSPPPEELARYFPQLEILELLGRGGMGAVYKARQKELDRIVALKILPPDIGEDPAFSERFTREARALAKLNHPHIVTLYDFGQADGLYYFFMEYVDGANLRQVLNGGRMAAKEALAIVPQICDALQYAHDRGIVHRDIKPENILLGRDGTVKIADFGVARLLTGDSATPPDGESTRVVGTPSYMAPEQVNTPQEVDHRADIYSLGVVLYQMLTGELPGHNLLKPSRRVRIDVRIDEIVLRALEQNPEQRYQQASVLRTQLETLATAPASPAPPETPASVWRRLWAFVIDVTLVPIAVFPLLALLAVFFPQQFVLEVPFGLFTEEKVIKTDTVEEDGHKSRVRQIEVTPLGLETYTYTEFTPLDRLDARPKRHLADPLWAIRATPTSEVNALALFLYWILLESSPLQASLGKRLLGLRVTDRRGRRLGFWQSLWRNAAKLLTLATGGIGFLVAFITPGKRTLHDFLSRSRLVTGSAPTAPARPLLWRGALAVALAIALPLALNAYQYRWFFNWSENTVREMESTLHSRRRLLDQTSAPILPGLLQTLKEQGDAAGIEKLLSVDWETQRLFPSNDPMAISEREFMRLPYRERNHRQEPALEMSNLLGRLSRSTVKAGQDAVAAHDWTRAERCFTALQQLGRMIDRGDYMLTLHYMGQAMETAAIRRISELNAARSNLRGITYGPEKEVTLRQPTLPFPSSRPAYLRLSDGKLWTPNDLVALPEASEHFDLFATLSEKPALFGLMGQHMVALPIGGKALWDSLAADTAYHGAVNASPGNPVFIPFNPNGSDVVYVFRTRDDARGLLQILHADPASQTIRFRYKLAQLPKPPAGGDQTTASKVSPPEAFSSQTVAQPRLQIRAEAKDDDPNAETVPFCWGEEASLRLASEIALTEGDVFSAELEKVDASVIIALKLTDEGSLKFSDLTARTLQRRVAIVFDGKILSAPVVMAQIQGGSMSISGFKSVTEAQEILQGIRSAIRNRAPAGANFTITWITWAENEARGDTASRWLPDGSPAKDHAPLPRLKLSARSVSTKDPQLSFRITPLASASFSGTSATVTDSKGVTLSSGTQQREWLPEGECLYSVSILPTAKLPTSAVLNLTQPVGKEQLLKAFKPEGSTTIPIPGQGSEGFNILPAIQTPEGDTLLRIGYSKGLTTPENMRFTTTAILKNGGKVGVSTSSGSFEQGITTLRLTFKTPLSEVDRFEVRSERLETIAIPFEIPRAAPTGKAE